MQTPVASDTTIKAIADMAAHSGMRRVHMLAWRDLDDDEAGGSEIHAHNIAAIWAQAGVSVTMRTSSSRGRPATATRDGYAVSRRGSRYAVFPRSALAEMTRRLGPCDGLIEIWNGMPFFSPLWWRGPTSVWLHHVHGPMWGQTLPAPVARVGNLIEERLAPPMYRNRPVVTLSPSSQEELVAEMGFSGDRVSVIPPGVDPYFSPGGTRSATPLAVAVGRLAPVKDFPRLVRLMARVRESVPDVELVIVGEGYTREDILRAARAEGAEAWVHLPGRISDEALRDLYRRAWLAVSASTREGWGMTITEAAACGTPTVATDIAGHADAVADGRSGLLHTGDADLVAAITSVLAEADLRARLQEGALTRAAELTWESTAVANFKVLTADALALRDAGGRRRRGRGSR